MMCVFPYIYPYIPVSNTHTLNVSPALLPPWSAYNIHPKHPSTFMSQQFAAAEAFTPGDLQLQLQPVKEIKIWEDQP